MNRYEGQNANLTSCSITESESIDCRATLKKRIPDT